MKPDEPWKEKRNGSNCYPEQIRIAQLSSAGGGGFITADPVDQLHRSHVTGVATERGGDPRAQSSPGGSRLAGPGSDCLSCARCHSRWK